MRRKQQLLATLLILLSLIAVPLIAKPAYAPSPCSAGAVCIHAGVFQPVQTVWQDDQLYPKNDVVQGGPGGIPYIDSGDNIHWNADFPVIAAKNTYLFGTLGDLDGNRSTINIFVSDTIPGPGADPVELQITVTPPGTVIFTSSMFMVPRGGAILENLPAPLPSLPFQFLGRGLHEIRMKTIITNSANELIVHTDVGVPQQGLDLTYVPIAFQGDLAPGGGPIQNVTLPTGNDYNTMVQQSSKFVRDVYPLNESGVHVYSLPRLTVFPNPPLGAGDLERYEFMRDTFQLLGQILEHRTGLLTQIVVVVPDYHAHTPDGSWKQHWYGGSFLPAESYRPGGAPNVVFVEQGYWQVVAHEVTHNILRTDHDSNVADGYWVNANLDQPDGGAPAVCTTGPSGIAAVCKPRASLQNIPVATAAATIMFYHSLSALWPAKKSVRASFESFFDPFLVTDPATVIVTGKVFANETASLDNFYRFSQGSPSLSLGSTGNYSLVFRDMGGGLLASEGFNMSFTFTPAAFDPNPANVTLNPNGFSFVLPWVNGTKTIQLTNSTGFVLASRTVGDNFPSVTLTTPIGGESFPSGSVQTVAWTATYAGTNPLTYSVLYSGDNGTSWLPITIRTTSTSVAWNLTGVPAGNNYLVNVIATDGVNTGENVSSHTFSITTGVTGDISLTATPTCSGSGCASFATIYLTALSGFSGTVTLTDNAPSALICGPISPSSLTLPPSPAKATLACTSSAAGNYTIIVTATSAGLVRSANVTFSCSTVATPCSSAVGGQTVPIDKLAILTPLLGFISLLEATVAGIAYLSLRRRRNLGERDAHSTYIAGRKGSADLARPLGS